MASRSVHPLNTILSTTSLDATRGAFFVDGHNRCDRNRKGFVSGSAYLMARPARRRVGAHRDQSAAGREGMGAVPPVPPAPGPTGRPMTDPAAAAAEPRRPRGL